LINFDKDKDKDDEKLPKNQMYPMVAQHINWKNISNSMVATKFANYNIGAIQTQLNKLWS
jgi:hypothetical protein